MTKTLTTKDGSLKWDEVSVDDLLHLGDKKFPISVVRKSWTVTIELPSGSDFLASPEEWEELGAYVSREVDEHPYGLIPTEQGSVIRVYLGVYYLDTARNGTDDLVWYAYGSTDTFTATDLQEAADRYGFTRYLPEEKN